MKLVDLIDAASEQLEKDAAYQSFHLDGQTIILDDYLEIKPEKREELKKMVQEGKLTAGPWYILQDEFLTSGEACVRNLLTGRKEAKEFGKLCQIGYFPDAFGNAGQMPQVLAQAGMKAVVFGRGVKPVGQNNTALTGGAYESAYSEMKWKSPDGSELLGILFANWYNNGVEIPTDPAEAKRYWDEGLEKARKFAGTHQLLFMNGCDHQPVQKDLTKAIETARALYPDIEFIHTDFEHYIEAVEKELQEKELSVVQGELTSQETDGRWTLANTASSWVELKQMNREGETALERRAEPAAVFASLQGQTYPREFLDYSWKTLMQNHPHDSICSCDVDVVNEEVRMRFEKSRQVADQLLANSLDYLNGCMDTASLCGETKGALPFAVYNLTGWEKSGVVTVLLDVERCFDRPHSAAYEKMEQRELSSYVLKDAAGQTVEAKIEDAGVAFGYLLPDDKFRQPYMARQIRVTFQAQAVPAFGYRVWYAQEVPAEPEKTEASLVTGPCSMANEYLEVQIHEDGMYSLKNLADGRVYGRIGAYEDTGDIGNVYIYVQDSDKKTVTTQGSRARITLEEDLPFRAVYKICHTMTVPESADEHLDREQRMFQDIYSRTSGRSSRTTEIEVETRLILEAQAKGLQVETTIVNTAKDHRIRVMIPTGIAAETHYADSVFDVVKRNNRHSAMWTNPSGCDRQQCFVAMEDEKGGIMAANIGLYEYEILPDQENTIAITLLRCTGEMGDWGYFPAPKAQMQGTYTMRYEIMPYCAGARSQAYTEGYQFQNSLLSVPAAVQKGELPAENSFFSWEGEGVNLTSLKKSYEGEDIMVRFVNVTEEPTVVRIPAQSWFGRVYRSNVVEEHKGYLEQGAQNCYTMEIKPFEIATIGIELQ